MKFNDAREDRHQAHSELGCVRDELTSPRVIALSLRIWINFRW